MTGGRRGLLWLTLTQLQLVASTQDMIPLARSTADIMIEAQFARAVYINTLRDAGLQRNMRHALWQRGLAVIDAALQAPPVSHISVVLAGHLDDVVDQYLQLAQLDGVTSHLISWCLAVHSANISAVTEALASVMRENERSVVITCHHANCSAALSTSPGDGAVTLRPWQPGRQLFDWHLHVLGGRQLRVLAPLMKHPRNDCNSAVIGSQRLADGSIELCGYLGRTLLLLAEYLNFQPRFVRKSGCGVIQPDGSINGRPQRLLERRGDVGVGSCTKDLARSRLVHMGEWFWSDTTSLATGTPGPVPYSQFAVFKVFSMSVWMATSGVVMAAAALMYITERTCRATRRLLHVARLPNIVDYVQQSLRMFLAQGDDVTSEHVPVRVLMLAVYMGAVTLMAVYSGNLTAFLSLPRRQPFIDSLQQLADAAHIAPHVTYGQSHYYLLVNASGGARGRIWRRMSQCSDCVHDHYSTTSSDQFVQRMVAGQVALFQSTRSLLRRADQYLQRRNMSRYAPCPLHVAAEPLRRDFYTLQLRHNSRYVVAFDEAISQLRYAGIIAHFFQQEAASKCYQASTGSDADSGRGDSLRLGMARLRGVFLVWLCGMMAASALLLLELASRRLCTTIHLSQQTDMHLVSAHHPCDIATSPASSLVCRPVNSGVHMWTDHDKPARIVIKPARLV